MKFRSLVWSGLLALVLLSGCSEGEALIGKVNELLDQILEQSDKQEDTGKAEAAQATEMAEEVTTEEKENIDEEESTEAAEGLQGVSGAQASPPPEPETYEDDQGNLIDVTYGAQAFVSRVVEFTVGDPAPIEEYSNPETVLGEPDYDTWTGFLSLGGAGQLILEFEEVYLVDGPGEDLQVFEVGPSVEAIAIEISKDGKKWISIGEISGGTASVDIGPFVSPGDQFSYVKLIDLYTNSSGDSPGADIDAVVAINAVLK